MVVFILFVLDLLDKLGPKNQNCQLNLKFGTHTNSDMRNSMALLTFSVLDQKQPLRANMIQKIKLASLSRNLVLRVIRI